MREAGGRTAEIEHATRAEGWPTRVLDTLEQAVVALDRERRVVYCNRRFEEMLGVDGGALLGMTGGRLFPGAEARWLKGASREPREFRLEAEGRQVTLKAEALPLRDDEGELAGSVIVAETTSETEDGEFQKKIDRLVSLGELSAYVAHEIRNPLTGIRTTVQFVGSKFKPGDTRREDLEDVIGELDVRQVIDKTLAMIEIQLEDARVKLTREDAEDLPLIVADPDLLQQVFLNLSLNAVQAMPDGGELHVATAVRRYRTRRSMVDVSFADTGVGIPKELMERIFDPFFTTRSVGTGLGLPISVQIVREAGGVLTAKNNSGGGATMRASLPVPAEPAEKNEE